MSRTSKSLKNIKFAIIGQIGGVVISFISRIFFLKFLSDEYLGINSLFTNILTVLSFAELGFGTAITYSLYKPIAENDVEEVKTLMALFKKIYIYVGMFIIFAGLLLMPFLDFFIKDSICIDNIKIIFALFVFNSAFSYFFSYKRTLIIANQNRYIATIIRYVFYIIMNIIQVIVLFASKNYILFLIVQLVFTILENLYISVIANKIYPYLKDKKIKPLSKNQKKEITKNTKAMMLHKIGGIVVNSIDNIIISKYVGIVIVGFYSNYLLIKSGLETILSQIFSSISASVGNLCASVNKEKQYEVFKKLNFITFVLVCVATVSFYIVSKPFIIIWLGEKYVFTNTTILLIVSIFYITCMRKSVLTFREGLGLFYKDRYKPILEALINLVVSLLLAPKYGINGVLIGTIASSVLLTIEWEVAILYKYGFNKKIILYYKDYLLYALLTAICLLIAYCISKYICALKIYMYLFLSIITGIAIPILLILLLFNSTEEFKYVLTVINKNIMKRGV